MLGEAECLTENKDVIDYTKELFQHTLLYFPWTFISCGVKKKKKARKFSDFSNWQMDLSFLSLNLNWLATASSDKIWQK